MVIPLEFWNNSVFVFKENRSGLLSLFKSSYAELINDIKILGNDRISKETILMFSDI